MPEENGLIDEKFAEVSRVERKYQLSKIEAQRAYRMFSGTLKADRNNAGGAGYMVRSLYFDSYDDTDFYDKEGGYNERKKIRLRIYSPDSQYAKLEKKEKVGENQWKRSLTVSREDAEKMIAGDFSSLLDYPSEFARELYLDVNLGLYRPKCIVEYNRIAFIVPENDIRITLDSDIRATESSAALFDGKLSLYPVIYSDNVTLEVKYNRFLFTYIKVLLDSVDKSQVSNSKYSLGRSITQHGFDSYGNPGWAKRR